MKIGFIFPGQGSQYAGMGLELAEKFNEVKEVFEKADDILGFKISDMCFHGPQEKLNQTEITQPAILTTSIALLRLLENLSIKPDMVAGHSLGEYSALVCSGAFSFDDALRLVAKRSTYMQNAVQEKFGSMAAIIGLDREILEGVCSECTDGSGLVVCANFNSPKQIVISGGRIAVERAMEMAKDKGAKKAILLPVSVPSHSPFMEEAAAKMRLAFKAVEFKKLSSPLVTNVDARPIENKEDIIDALFRQLYSPVDWVNSVKYMINDGVDVFIEIGPKKVLSHLIRDINKELKKEIKMFNVEDIKSYDKLVDALGK